MKKVLKIVVGFLLAVCLIAGGVGLYIHLMQRTVSFLDDDGKVLHSITLKKGEKVSKPDDPQKYNCEFLGWKLDNNDYDFNNEVNDNITLTASYKYFYDVKFLDTDESELFETQKIEKGNKAIKPDDPYKVHNDFLGWKNGEENFDFETLINKNITLQANWLEYQPYDIVPDRDNFGFHCSIMKKDTIGYSYEKIKKLNKGLEFVCILSGEVSGGIHNIKSISYILEYGKGIKLTKTNDKATVKNNVRVVTLKQPETVFTTNEFHFKITDVSNKDELYVKMKDIKYKTTDDKYYYSPDKEIMDLTK